MRNVVKIPIIKVSPISPTPMTTINRVSRNSATLLMTPKSGIRVICPYSCYLFGVSCTAYLFVREVILTHYC